MLIDLGPSMFFATQGALKSVIAAQAACLIGWAAAARGDRIGALLFNGGHTELKPRSGHRGVLQLIHALTESADPLRGLETAGDPHDMNDALAGGMVAWTTLTRKYGEVRDQLSNLDHDAAILLIGDIKAAQSAWRQLADYASGLP